MMRSNKKAPRIFREGLSIISLTMSYFHTGIRTIIGAEAFHGPVRDGKEWGHLAMVIRLDWSLLQATFAGTANSQSRCPSNSGRYQILIAHRIL